MKRVESSLEEERFLGEHAEGYWNNFNRLPPELAARIPRTFSLLARRPR